MAKAWDNFVESAEKYIKFTPVEDFNYAVNVSLKYRYVYVETAKVACSTIKLTLQKMELEYPVSVKYTFKDIHNRVYSPLLRLQQLPQFEQLFESGDFFVFCFVRNPYERLLSAYLDKMIKNPGREKKLILSQLGRRVGDLNEEVSFSDFVSAIQEQPIYYMNNHWRPQYYSTYQQSIKYDFVGRFETFSEDFSYVGSLLSDEFSFYFSNERSHGTDSRDLISDYYDASLFEKVYSIYKIDFEYFGYPIKFLD